MVTVRRSANLKKVVVNVYNGAIESEFTAGGEVSRENNKIRKAIIRRATAEAPSRTGTLKAAHRDNGALLEGRLRLRGSVENTAEHALWVHDGTTGPIRARGRYLVVPARRGLPPRRHGGTVLIYPGSVHGQTAQPWLERAGEAVALSWR